MISKKKQRQGHQNNQNQQQRQGHQTTNAIPDWVRQRPTVPRSTGAGATATTEQQIQQQQRQERRVRYQQQQEQELQRQELRGGRYAGSVTNSNNRYSSKQQQRNIKNASATYIRHPAADAPPREINAVSPLSSEENADYPWHAGYWINNKKKED